MGRRPPPTVLCESYADGGFASSTGDLSPGATVPKRRHICGALDPARRDPLCARKDIFVALPRTAELRRATLAEMRSAPLRVRFGGCVGAR